MNWFAWALLSAVFAGLTAVLAKVGVNEVPSHLATAIRTTVVVGLTWLIAATTAQVRDVPSIAPRSWIFLSLSGVATAISWLCYFRALQLGEVSKVAPVDKLSVPIAVLLAVLFLSERLELRDTIAVALIVLGTVMLAWE
jgi:bacterial/archaeal transporter family protein